MIKNIRGKVCFTIFSLLIFSVFVSACSIDLSQNPNATTSPPTPQGNRATSVLPTISIPVTWATLNLTGRLVYTSVDPQTSAVSIKSLDLAKGETSTIFQAPDTSWVYFSAVSPDSKQLVISYSPPTSNTSNSRPALYLLPIDGSAPPSLLFTPHSDLDEYNQPVWSSDGKYIYFFHITLTPLTSKGQQVASVGLERLAYPDGQPEKVMESAFWPRVSNDSKHLVYVSINPQDGKNKLYLSNMDGSGAQEIVMSGTGVPDIIDAPIFSPDGQSILFSAIVPTKPASSTWLEKLLGVTVASAHTVPSEWFLVPISGGPSSQLTHVYTTGLYASFSPDGKFMASTSGLGLFAMHPDGSDLTMLLDNSAGELSTVSWIP
jgi:Tol biopolymer transport system component